MRRWKSVVSRFLLERIANYNIGQFQVENTLFRLETSAGSPKHGLVRKDEPKEPSVSTSQDRRTKVAYLIVLSSKWPVKFLS